MALRDDMRMPLRTATNLTLPPDLVAQVDEIAGPRGRSRFVEEAVRRELRRERLREALERTYAATADPKWVVAVGNCAFDGGIFAGSYAVAGGVSAVVPVDLHIKGCPPSPSVLLTGLLALLEDVALNKVPAAGRPATAAGS